MCIRDREVGKQDAEAVEAYVHAAVKTMSHEKQVALAARILKLAQMCIRDRYCMTWQDAIKQKLLPMLSVMTDWCWRGLLIMETSSPACAVLSKV